MKDFIEAFELIFQMLNLTVKFLFTPPMLYFTLILIFPTIIATIIKITKIFRKKHKENAEILLTINFNNKTSNYSDK